MTWAMIWGVLSRRTAIYGVAAILTAIAAYTGYQKLQAAIWKRRAESAVEQLEERGAELARARVNLSSAVSALAEETRKFDQLTASIEEVQRERRRLQDDLEEARASAARRIRAIMESIPADDRCAVAPVPPDLLDELRNPDGD